MFGKRRDETPTNEQLMRLRALDREIRMEMKRDDSRLIRSMNPHSLGGKDASKPGHDRSKK